VLVPGCNLAYVNRVFYPNLATMDVHVLRSTLTAILVYAMLELVSFLGLCVVLHHRRLRISPVQQLAFVLHKQWKLVQSKMVLWVVVTIGTSLEQLGTFSTSPRSIRMGVHIQLIGRFCSQDTTTRSSLRGSNLLHRLRSHISLISALAPRYTTPDVPIAPRWPRAVETHQIIAAMPYLHVEGNWCF
jgi:hypothetical protein